MCCFCRFLRGVCTHGFPPGTLVSPIVKNMHIKFILQWVLMTKARAMIWSWSAGAVAVHCIHQDGFNASSSSSPSSSSSSSSSSLSSSSPSSPCVVTTSFPMWRVLTCVVGHVLALFALLDGNIYPLDCIMMRQVLVRKGVFIPQIGPTFE